MGIDNSFIYEIIGIAIGLIVTVWFIMQLPHLNPLVYAIIGIVLSIAGGALGWKVGARQKK